VHLDRVWNCDCDERHPPTRSRRQEQGRDQNSIGRPDDSNLRILKPETKPETDGEVVRDGEKDHKREAARHIA